MFEEVSKEAKSNKITTGITTVAIVSGLIYGMHKKKGFWGVFACTIGFGLVGVVAGIGIEQIVKD